MKRKYLGWLILAILVVSPAAALMTIEPITGRYTPVSRTPVIDKDVQDLGNAPGRVAGERTFFSGVGIHERLYFAGDARALNAFLRRFADQKVNTLLVTVHHAGARPQPYRGSLPRAGEPCVTEPEPAVHYDWMMTRYLPQDAETREGLSLDVWVRDRLPWERIVVPKNVRVEHKDRPGSPNQGA